jgi:hypothetical protein
MRRIALPLFVALILGLLLTPAPSRADGHEHYMFIRPTTRHLVDRGLPFGWTRYGQSPLHHGVDFENGLNTPVYAAADGTVAFAGNDSSDVIGPQPNFYGNAVIITHDFSADGGPVSTLYGHLYKVLVQPGQRVTKGQKIGTVGMTGIAIWYHLHFEVRVGNPHDYNSVRNPELWLIPLEGRGTLVGRMVDQNGGLAIGIKFTLHRPGYTVPGWTYADPNLHTDPAYNENFVMGDLAAGCYEFAVRDNNGGYAATQKVCIKAGQNTYIDVKVGKIY